MRRLWYKWCLYWATAKARKAKALWLATKESTQPKTTTRYDLCPHRQTEGAYCNALIQQRMYEKLLNPRDIPKATAK